MPGKVFDKISNQKFNDHIKTICQKAGIDSDIMITVLKGKERFRTVKPKYMYVSSHLARATFVTLAITNDIHTEIIMKITGHVKRKAMNRYSKLSANDLANAFLTKFNQ